VAAGAPASSAAEGWVTGASGIRFCLRTLKRA
jgi:hypothetical protein